jgi:dTDP-4-dehydrorhamnose reductase
MNNNDFKVLITGSGGMLGASFCEIIAKLYPNIKVIGLNKEDLDVSDREAVLECQKYCPNVIIHAAAIVNADYCEIHYKEAYSVIVGGTKNILELATICNAKVLYPQSFLIFSEDNYLIDENTIPSPLSVYGKLKFKSEEIIKESSTEYLIIRMGGFFGGFEKDKNFVGKIFHHMLDLISSGKKELKVGDRIWQPTFTDDISANSLLLLNNNKQGVYNMSSIGYASFYDIAKKITQYAGIENSLSVSKVPYEELDKLESAKRPSRAIMLNTRLDSERINIQRRWEESLFDYLNDGYFQKLLNKIKK